MKWYAKDQGNGQGLIIDEETGRNVAVAYDRKDAAMLAAAPGFLAALRQISREKDKGKPTLGAEVAAGVLKAAGY